MRAHGPLFDLAADESAKEAGRSRAAAKCRDYLLAFVRDAVRRAALSRLDRLATSDDAYSFMADVGKDAAELGNAEGAIFSGDEWEAAGWKPSKRKSNHARVIREWRLRG
ncbi:hypothetical protein [Granulicella sp. L46]|uniref:hypothetical protein n=1 Tax=Granulicella sp. L46 TaxID=1641865 RepID=UPI00131C14FB|nr:hypothetical protein [Granulicella sp. L46]